jgi:hypothetical protein
VIRNIAFPARRKRMPRAKRSVFLTVTVTWI